MLALNPLFRSGAVFQQGKPVPVWGTAEPDHRLKAEFAGKTAYSRSSATGRFELCLPALTAGGPHTLTVTDLNSGETVSSDDILVGEVWVASGQSNMEYAIGSDWAVPSPDGEEEPVQKLNEIQKEEFCSTIRDPFRMRYLLVRKTASGLKEDSFKGEWKYMTPENAPEASAVASWFGRFIQEKVDVPVGLIMTYWGGSPVESWTSRSGLLSNPETVPLVLETDEELRAGKLWEDEEFSPTNPPRSFQNEMFSRAVEDPGNKGVKLGWADPGFDDSEWKTMKIPGSWIAQKISGNGAVWVRMEVTLDDSWLGKDLVLEMGGIDKMDTTYFNGTEIGKTGEGLDTQYWNQPRKYTVPAGLLVPGKNVIAVRAYSFIYDGAFTGKKSDYLLTCPETGNRIRLAGLWKACAEFDLGHITPPALPIGPGNHQTPSILFNAMIRPLVPYAIRGVIWYQGENNAKTMEDASSYLKKIETMIRDWRHAWEQGDFPFIQVELADYQPEVEPQYNPASPWAILRECQRKVCEVLPQVYLASAVGVGDLHDIHPQDKKTVGHRLAVNALRNVYHISETVPCGPVLQGCSPEGNRIRLMFRNAAGLEIRGDISRSFYLADTDRIFFPAEKYTLDGDWILLESSEVDHPVAVRYCWAQAPVPILYNGAGLPAFPFRTDDWPIRN